MCLHRKVIAGLVVAALGTYLVAPNMVANMLPLLLVAACPLSMLFMDKMMGGRAVAGAEADSGGGESARRPGEAGLIRDDPVASIQVKLERLGDQQAERRRRFELTESGDRAGGVSAGRDSVTATVPQLP